MSRRSVLVVALAIAFILVGMGVARAETSARGPRRANLPRGWTWPPSRETRRDGRRCLRELRSLGVRFKRAPRKRMIATPVLLSDLTFGTVTFEPTYRKPPFIMDCRLARAFATHASIFAALGIRELRFSSIYDYRRVRLRQKTHRALSRHSLGLAVDIFEVVLDSGVKLVVRKDYWSSPALMVAELALRASGDFRAILSPAVDPVSHGDHLHLEVKVEHPERTAKKHKKKHKKKRARRVSRLRD
jgi:hypothetical protein